MCLLYLAYLLYLLAKKIWHKFVEIQYFYLFGVSLNEYKQPDALEMLPSIDELPEKPEERMFTEDDYASILAEAQNLVV